MIKISHDSDEPLYYQIKKQIQKQMIDASLLPGDPLPSIRGLARQLDVSVITVKKAYQELEKQALIYTTAKKGSIVSENVHKLKAQQERELKNNLREAVEIAKFLNIDLNELMKMLEEEYKNA